MYWSNNLNLFNDNEEVHTPDRSFDSDHPNKY